MVNKKSNFYIYSEASTLKNERCLTNKQEPFENKRLHDNL